jgi:hypothetical protein
MKKTPVLRSGGNVIIVMDGEKTRVTRVESEYRFAFGLRNAARVMVNSARGTAEKDSHERKAFVTGAIVLAYSSLEAALNEFVFLNSAAPNSPLSEECKAVMNAIALEDLRPQGGKNALQMFNVMLRLMRKPELRESEKTYQAANLVRILRNLLVHPFPGRVVTYSEDAAENLSEQQHVVRQLRSHLALDQDATFPCDVITSKCAAWAVASCEDFLRDFVRQSGVDPGFLTEQ